MSQLLTIRDAADLLAVSTRTVERLIASKELCAVKVRSSTRIESREIHAYLSRARGGDLPPEIPSITEGQLRAFHAKAGNLDQELGLDRGDSKQHALALATKWFGRVVESANDLTAPEASRLLDHLDEELKAARS